MTKKSKAGVVEVDRETLTTILQRYVDDTYNRVRKDFDASVDNVKSLKRGESMESILTLQNLVNGDLIVEARTLDTALQILGEIGDEGSVYPTLAVKDL